MNRTWLVLDCNYLCHRAKHTFKELSFNGSVTGAIYGVLKDILYFRKEFSTPYIVFCWDYGKSMRKGISETYKAHRKKELNEEDLLYEKAFRKQMNLLREKYLPAIGYKNIFYQEGYEADDIIASVCNNLPKGDEAVIVSADHDLYQLINKNVCVFHPQRQIIVSVDLFEKEYEISPKEWTKVKAIAGCSSDNIIGIQGVGEKTAIKYLNNKVKPSSKVYQKLTEQAEEMLKKNLPLVELPLKGTKIFKLKKDRLSKEGWHKVIRKLGIKSLKEESLFV